MSCEACVEKLQERLIKKYGMNRFEAWDRAYRALTRYESRVLAEGPPERKPPRSPTWFEAQTHKHKSGHNPDYVQDCSGTETCACIPRIKPAPACFQASVCADWLGGCQCPAPLPNSSEVSDNCTTTCRCGEYPAAGCPDYAGCYCLNTCGYDCDDPYVWDPVLEECVLPAGHFLGDGIVMTESES